MANLETWSILSPRLIPSADEIRLSKGIIEQLDQEIEDLEGQISKLQTRLEHFKHRRATHASYISPFRRLPIELLGDILSKCLEDNCDVVALAQVCARLRAVALGMTQIWSNISLRSMERTQRYRRTTSWRYYGSSLEGGIQCVTSEQLALVLTRIGSAPLRLHIQWPAEEGTLELISSRQLPIHSLAVLDGFNTPIAVNRFKGLNVGDLKQLKLQELIWQQGKPIMDLALQSKHCDMNLEITRGDPTLDLFKHKLIQRVTDISIAIRGSGHGSFPKLNESTGVLLSHIKSWRIECSTDILDVIDLKGADSLRFASTKWPPAPTISTLPNQLTKLVLGNVKFTRGQGPHHLPDLISMELEDVVFEGLVQQYFNCPKLRWLHFSTSIYDPIFHSINKFNHYKASAWELFDRSFFRGVPNLESLSLHGLLLDIIFAATLEVIPLLRNLNLEDCRVEQFIHWFLRSLQNPEAFPSLNLVQVDNSWPIESDISFPEFARAAIGLRPDVRMSGNGRVELASPSFSDSDSLFSF
ncbi:hypothetical protein CPB86DRAFT_823378 [Serendipita vermifera]|nr:hypothetical protein CPB86DRAFT_823378 [Serendipita vermifera]